MGSYESKPAIVSDEQQEAYDEGYLPLTFSLDLTVPADIKFLAACVEQLEKDKTIDFKIVHVCGSLHEVWRKGMLYSDDE